jgi:short-subunit dehydrogenase
MVTVYCDVHRMDPADYARVTDVTYLGAVWGTLAALRRMRPRNAGTIVQVGSALAYRSIPLQSAYCAAKSALRGFTDALRCELIRERSGVHVTMVHPAAFNTPQFDWAKNRMEYEAQPVGPVFQPELAAAAIYRAAHERRREAWIGWPAVGAILGTRLLPAVLDHSLANRAYKGQQDTSRPREHHPHNLYEPVRADQGAHGRFSARARSHSAQVWASQHRLPLAAAAMLALAALAVGRTRR